MEKELGQNWGDNTGGIWNVLCKAGSSNFWTQRPFSSSANKYLSAAFSDTAQNRCTLVREVRILFSESCNRPPEFSCRFQYLRFDHAFLAVLDAIVAKWIDASLIIASNSIESCR